MSDFINQLPPSMREAIERYQMPEVSDDILTKLKEKLMAEPPENDEEFTKAKRQ